MCVSCVWLGWIHSFILLFCCCGGLDGQGLTVKIGCLVSSLKKSWVTGQFGYSESMWKKAAKYLSILILPSFPCQILGASRNLQATEDAMAALRHDGRVITWGCSKSGGDSCAVQEQLDSIEMLAGSVGGKKWTKIKVKIGEALDLRFRSSEYFLCMYIYIHTFYCFDLSVRYLHLRWHFNNQDPQKSTELQSSWSKTSLKRYFFCFP